MRTERERLDVEAAEREAKSKDMVLFRPLAEEIGEPPIPRISFGLPELDERLGGGLANGYHLLIGYTHSGKSLLLETMVVNNADRNVVIITPDETVDMVVNKLLERVGFTDDELKEMKARERRARMADHFPNLAICDRNLMDLEVDAYLLEYSHVYGEIDLVIYDYLELLRGAKVGDDVQRRAAFFKDLAKTHRCPVAVIHQGSRSGSANGQPLTLSSGMYGGEREAFVCIGVYQRKFDPEIGIGEKRHLDEHPTLHVQILKNKQKARRGLTPAGEGIAFAISESGVLRPQETRDKLNPSPAEVGQLDGKPNSLIGALIPGYERRTTDDHESG